MAVTDKDQKEHWHISKSVPLAFITALLVQTGGMIWWAATLSAKLDNMISQMADFKSERYTANDAKRDFELQSQKYVELERRINRLEVGTK